MLILFVLFRFFNRSAVMSLAKPKMFYGVQRHVVTQLHGRTLVNELGWMLYVTIQKFAWKHRNDETGSGQSTSCT